MCYAPRSPKTCDNDDDLRVASTREMGEGHHPRDQLLGCNLFKKILRGRIIPSRNFKIAVGCLVSLNFKL